MLFDNCGATRRLSKLEMETGKISISAHRYQLFPLYSDGAASKIESFMFRGIEYVPRGDTHWKTDPKTCLPRLALSERVEVMGSVVRYRRFANDFCVIPMTDRWESMQGGVQRTYVVQTATSVIERCLLMTTDPGDLVLDPTCGSGTTAFVAEQWGRRWITMDTSRVALALAKQRLLTARFPYFTLRPLNAEDLARNPKGVWLNDTNDPAAIQPKPRTQDTETTPDPRRTFLCKTVPHITLKSIARNTALDPIFAQYEPLLAEKLADLNAALKHSLTPVGRNKPLGGVSGETAGQMPETVVGRPYSGLQLKLIAKLEAKARDEGIKKITEADCRRWLLPGTQPTAISHKKALKLRERIPPQAEWREWEVPFDTDPDWPPALQAALIAYRQTWRAKMDAVNACISAHADTEELVDKPEEQKGVIRVSGPFTLEGVIALEEGPDSPIGGAPESLDSFAELDQSAAVVNAEAHLDKILRLLRVSGVDFPGNQNIKFTRLEAITSPSLLHAEGEWTLKTDSVSKTESVSSRVAVSIGPAVGNLTAFQVEDAVRAANRKGYDDLVFGAFGFDAMAQDAIVSSNDRDLRTHMALIRPDVAMDELLKTQPGSQIFTVFAAPRIKGPTPLADGEYTVEVEGMDVYDPVSNQLYPTDKDRIAAWFLDSDYDGRTFCICQAFFPDKSKWAKLAKALGEKGVIDEEKFAALSGLVSLPFHRPVDLQTGKVWRVAVKVIDPRGNEGLRVVEVG
jgi:adenine-specific DNA-methyltransferase